MVGKQEQQGKVTDTKKTLEPESKSKNQEEEEEEMPDLKDPEVQKATSLIQVQRTHKDDLKCQFIFLQDRSFTRQETEKL